LSSSTEHQSAPDKAEDSASADEREAMNSVPPRGMAPAVTLSFMDRAEAFIARLSTKSTFWHRVCSMIWLPYAFKSGIKMKKVDSNTFAAELPFRRFNRNWYNAMAGAALLANSEIAGGMYIFGITGGDYTLVCKELTYKFLRPCFGPALYRITPREDVRALIATGKEFNITVDLEVIQQPMLPAALGKHQKKDSVLARLAQRERRVGKCVATFHVTPTIHQKTKRGDVRKVGN
jgi:hypothetical protein